MKMKIRKYEKREPEPKPKKAWGVDVVNYGVECVAIIAVCQETGQRICNLAFITPKGIERASCAKDLLDQKDYDTSCTKWVDGGLLANV